MPQTPQVQLSIALVTMNRPESLQLSLESLRNQSTQPFEIVVSDDSAAEYQREVQKVAALFQCRYIPGPRRGLYANRNHAAINCTGTHIRTMDDDHRFPDDHLATCIDAVSSDPNSIWTTGERGFIDGEYYATLMTANQLHKSGFGANVEDPDDNWAIADGSSIYPSEVYRRGYRMVEWYGFGPSYLEFGPYLYKRGFKSRCVKGTVIEHYADRITLNRLHEPQAIDSRLFASLCFNLYFRPNKFLAFKYFVACLRESGYSARLIQLLPTTITRVNLRWQA
jgi:glycosyltransferase involved in cell wall biosynthesis